MMPMMEQELAREFSVIQFFAADAPLALTEAGAGTALIQVLSDGRIAGAGLDVFTDEPNVPAALLTMENVVLFPHVGSGTRETRRAMVDLVLANLRQFQADGALLTPVY